MQITDTVRIWAFQNADYDWRTFDLDRDMPVIDKKIGFVDAVDPDLRAFNEIQLAVWKTHVGALSFPVFSSIPCLITEHATQLVDYTLITEYPDETIYGDAFRLAHRTQMRTVLAAVTLYRAGIGENGLGGAGTSMTGAAICGQRQDS